MSANQTPERAAEASVLGAILLEPKRAVEVAAQLVGDDFGDARNQRAYEAILTLTERSEPTDLVSLANEMRARGTLEAGGGMPRLTELLGCVTSVAHLAHHVRIVAQSAAVRRVAQEAGEIQKRASGVTPLKGSVPEFLQESVEQLINAASTHLMEVPAFAAAEAQQLRESLAAGPIEGLEGLRTGFNALDSILCGMHGGDLVVVGARPSVGKTVLLSDIALSALADEGSSAVAFFSLEMRKRALVERMASSLSGVDHYLIRTRRMSEIRRQAVNDALDRIGQFRLVICDAAAQSIMSIRAQAQKIKQRFGLRLVLVDYLQLVTSPGAESRLQEVSEISRALKALALELDVPVIAAAQLNRAGDTGPEGRPRLSNLRESGTIEADADIVILLHQVRADCGANESRVVETIVAKNRNGPQGTARLLLQPSLVRFVNLEDPQRGRREGDTRSPAEPDREGTASGAEERLPGLEEEAQSGIHDA